MIVPRGEYVEPWTMEERLFSAADLKKKIRAWRYRKKWTTLMRGSGANCFLTKRKWTTEEELGEFIEELSRAGFKNPMPGSHAWAWTETHHPPPTNPTLRLRVKTGGLRASRPRAWQEAIKRGVCLGRFNVYDLNSAYAAEAQKPLPDPRLVVYTSSVTRRPFGLYLLAPEVEFTAPIVPRRLRNTYSAGHWVTKEELQGYDAKRVRVLSGMEWDKPVDLRWNLDEIFERFSYATAKKILRAFWGGWACDKTIEQWKTDKGEISPMKPLHSRQFCPVWASHLLARVALRCATDGGAETVHVFTDSVMTTRTLPTGTEMGAWKLVQTIDNPWVSGAGIWGFSRDHLIKHAGKAAHPKLARNIRGLVDTAPSMMAGADRWTEEVPHEHERDGESGSCLHCRASMETGKVSLVVGADGGWEERLSPLTDSRSAGMTAAAT